MKQFLKYLVLVLLGAGIGFLVFKGLEKPVVPPEKPDISKELHKIDSLENKIKENEDLVAVLRDSIKQKKTVVIVKEVEKIKTMPLDENVTLLRANLEKHGELTQPGDTLPSIIQTPEQGDSLVLLSENNVKDVNCIVKKYEGEMETNALLEDIIQVDSVIIDQKDSIIQQKSCIIIEQDYTYNQNIENLQKSLQKQKTKKVVGYGVLGTVTAVLLGMLLAK